MTKHLAAFVSEAFFVHIPLFFAPSFFKWPISVTLDRNLYFFPIFRIKLEGNVKSSQSGKIESMLLGKI